MFLRVRLVSAATALFAASALALTGNAHAFPVEGTVVADDYHQLYTGQLDGSGLVAHGPAVFGFGAGATYDYDFSHRSCDSYLYLVAWSNDSVSQGLLHDLTIGGVPHPSCAASTAQLYSDWEVCATGSDKDNVGPSSADVSARIALCNAGSTPSGGWVAPTCGGPNDGSFPPSNPWCTGPCAGIDPNARWSWYDSGSAPGPEAPFRPYANHQEYLIFRIHFALPTTHMKCYKITDSQVFSGLLDLTSPQFGLDPECKIKGKAVEFCVPACKRIVEAEFHSGQPLEALPINGVHLTEDQLCYKVKCGGDEIPPQVDVRDQFGRRFVRTKSTFKLCTPAEKVLPGQLSVRKFHDLNGDGIKDPQEPTIPNWPISIPSLNQTESTDIDGQAEFLIPPGTYVVEEETKSGWIATGLGLDPTQQTVTLLEGVGQYISFANRKLRNGVVAAFKFNDLNRNGVWDSNEPPLEGWEFEVFDGATLVTSGTTDASGLLQLFVLEGTYTISEVAQAGWVPTTATSQQVEVYPETSSVGFEFGNVQGTCPDRLKLVLFARADGPCTTNADCGAAECVAGQCISDTDLDLGWTGIAHDQSVNDRVKLWFDLQCSAPGPLCGECDVPSFDCTDGNCRCASDNRQFCDEPFGPDTDCGSGNCLAYLGPPLPLSAGNTPTCVVNRLRQEPAGTFNVDTGDSSIALALSSEVYQGGALTTPCPYCDGDPQPCDGLRQGSCVGGRNDGLTCDGGDQHNCFAEGPSLDCLPELTSNVSGAGLSIDTTQTTDSISLAATQPCVTSGTCPCSAQNLPNQCDSGVCIDTGTPANAPDGECSGGPVDKFCDGALLCDGSGYISCSTNADCDAFAVGVEAGDCTLTETRECFSDPIVATGTADAETPIFVSAFCVPPTSSAGINITQGYRGPARTVVQTSATAFCGATTYLALDGCQ